MSDQKIIPVPDDVRDQMAFKAFFRVRNAGVRSLDGELLTSYDVIAKIGYEVADALMKARGR